MVVRQAPAEHESSDGPRRLWTVPAGYRVREGTNVALALPGLSRAMDRTPIADGTYFVVQAKGELVACGGTLLPSVHSYPMARTKQPRSLSGTRQEAGRDLHTMATLSGGWDVMMGP